MTTPPPQRKPRPQPRRNNAAPAGRRSRGPRTDQVQEYEPQRLHKLLAEAGYGSRRELEEWIVAGRVSVNGLPADVGQKIGPGDRVKINGKLVNIRFTERAPRVLIYHKQEGEIVSRDDPEGRPSVFDRLPIIKRGRWIAIGRLDFNTSGLLLFTNNGELANRMMHPRYELEREYAVRLIGELSEEQIATLKQGVALEDGEARFNSLVDAGGEGSNHWYHVTISEGRNREVRRMFEAVGLTVSRLMRVRYGPVLLPRQLRRGAWGEMPEGDVKALLEALPQLPEVEAVPGMPAEDMLSEEDFEAEDAEAWAKAQTLVVPTRAAMLAAADAPPLRAPRGPRKPMSPGGPRSQRQGKPYGNGNGNSNAGGNGGGNSSGNGNGKSGPRPGGKPGAAKPGAAKAGGGRPGPRPEGGKPAPRPEGAAAAPRRPRKPPQPRG